MRGYTYLVMLLLSAALAAMIAYLAAIGPDVEIEQLPEIQPIELRD